MDIKKVFNSGGVMVPNPNYNPKSKKNTEPPLVLSQDLSKVGSIYNDLNVASDEFGHVFTGQDDARKAEIYQKFGLTLTKDDYYNGNLDRQLADAQSASSKLIHGVEQAIVSEIGIGTIKAFSDIADAIGQYIGASDKDYSNPLSRTLEEWQNKFNEDVAPIYTTPGVDIAHGGLGDAGWWASNMPSIMSSLTLLIPSSGIVKGIGYVGKAAKASSVGRQIGKATTAAARWSARATKLDNLDVARKTYGYLTSTQGQALLKEGTKVAATAALSRTMENYQEARQVYDDMYAQASKELAKMKPEQYAAFLNRNETALKGVDTNNKDEVAKAIARTSADRTFAIDYLNTVSDIMQIYALRNMFKGVRNIGAKSKITRAHRQSLEALAAKNAGKEFTPSTGTAKNIKNWFVDNLFDSKTAIAGEFSEGVEEAVNYIAQQEGMNLGSVMLDASKDSTFGKRLAQYGKEPGLYESAFWGILGGVVFQGLGSGFKRAELAVDKYIDYKNRKENPKTKEQVKKPSFFELWETPEYKRRVADINARNTDLQDYINKLDMIINKHKNPYETGEDGQSRDISAAEEDFLKEKAYNDMLTNMTLRAMDSGNYDLLKEYLKSDEVKQALVQSGLVSEQEATAYQQNAIANMEKLEEKYDENVRVLNSLSARINRNREESIPVEYLQIIARNNINHQLQIEDWQKQLDAYQVDATKQEQFFGSKLDPSINYKDAVRLTFLTAQLGELEADKKELLKDKDRVKTVEGQQELESINKNIETFRDIIYNINPNEGVSNLLFAIGNSFSFERFGSEAKSNLSSSEYLGFRDMLANLEREEDVDLQSQAKEYFTKIDKRLTSITGSQIQQNKVLDDVIRRAHDKEQGLAKVATDLHKTYMHLADLQTAIALERGQIAITENEVLNEVNNLHNFMNKARREAINKAKSNLIKLADKYGALAIRNALADKYRGNTVTTDYFGDTEEDLANGKLFNNATDILHLDSNANKNLFGVIDDILALHEDIKAAQNQSSTIFQEPDSGSQNSEVDNTSAETIETKIKPLESETEGIATAQSPLEQVAQTKPIELKDNGETYAILTPSSDVDGGYTLDVVQGQPKATALLNDDSIYQKNGVSITEDFVITQKPIVKRNADGSLTTIEKGLIDKATEDNITKAGEEEANNPIGKSNEPVIPASPSSTGVVQATSVPIKATNSNFESEGLQTEESSDDTLISKANEEIKEIVITAIKKQSSVDWNSLRDNLNKKYVETADDSANVGHYVDVAINSWKRLYDRNMAGKSNIVDEVTILNSSISEKTKKGKILEDYHKAVDKLVETYKEEVACDYIDGKYYVRISDLLNYCNDKADNTGVGDLLYQNMLNYMNNSDKFVVIAENLEDVLAKAKQSTQSKLANLNNTNTLYGINFDGYIAELIASGMNNEAAKVLDIIDNLQLGDKISYKKSDNTIMFMVGDTPIGYLPIPRTAGLPLKNVVPDGRRWQYNDEWVTDILVNPNGTVTSSLKELFRNWLTNLDNKDIADLNNIVIQAAFNIQLKQSDLNKLADKFSKNPEVITAINNGFIKPDADKVKLLKGIAKVWGYTRQITGKSIEETNKIRLKSLDYWFDNVANSFYMVEQLYNTNAANVTVGSISEGELIRTSKEDKVPIKNALGDKHKGKVKIAIAEKIGTITLAGSINGNTKLDYSGVKQYSTVCVIPARNNKHGFVHAFGANINSKQVSGKAKEIVKAAISEIKRIGTQGTTEEIGENLRKYLMLLLNNGNNTNSPLFRTNGLKTFGIQPFIYEHNDLGFQINYRDVNGVYHWFTVTWKSFSKESGVTVRPQLAFHHSGIKKITTNTEETINELIKVILENTHFDIGKTFIQSDNNKDIILNKSLAHRDKDGKFIISIPNQGDFEFESYNDFMLSPDNNIISLTTKPSINGTNYNRQSITGNQAANQTLKIRFEDNSRTPVEESEDMLSGITKTTSEQVLDILKDSKHSRTAGRRLAKLILGKKVKNLKIDNKIFDLFPQNIKFVNENIGAFADVNVGNDYTIVNNNENIKLAPGQVVVGKEWLDLLNGSITQKKEAVRKLVHERLHLVLHSDGNNKYVEQIREIFDEFKEKNTNENLNVYYYLDNQDKYYKNGKLNEAGLEEFLVETLTSKELADGLNSIQSEDIINNKKVKKSLLQKIMERLAKIFGWNIEAGSLYEKEFKLLGDIMSESTEDTNSNKQLEFNFNAPITDTTVKKEQEIKSNDDMSFGDDISDLFESAIQEKSQNTTSIPAFVNKFPITQQAKIVDKINSGEIEIKCN